MFLLLLMGLGAASVKAQVRIGGNTAPSKAAVLDLNATDATNAGTGGLVLPRVDLTSNTMPLTTGVANVTGTMVYDVTATLGQTGIYYWEGSTWVQASLPPTSMGDSGHFLLSNGSGWQQAPLFGAYKQEKDSIKTLRAPTPVTWSLIADTFATVALRPNTYHMVYVHGVRASDLCLHSNDTYMQLILISHGSSVFIFNPFFNTDAASIGFRCYRASS